MRRALPSRRFHRIAPVVVPRPFRISFYGYVLVTFYYAFLCNYISVPDSVSVAALLLESYNSCLRFSVLPVFSAPSRCTFMESVSEDIINPPFPSLLLCPTSLRADTYVLACAHNTYPLSMYARPLAYNAGNATVEIAINPT